MPGYIEMNVGRKIGFMKKIAFILAVCLLALCLCGCDAGGMTEEEFAEYRASCIAEYEVCSVKQYISTETNRFGGVVDTGLCYAFTYIDGNGNLKTVDKFEHLEYGLTKVCLGDSNSYVVDSYGEEKRYLYLTKETLSSLTE